MSGAETAELTLPGVTASVPAARRFVRSTLQSWELEGLAEAASLVVSELATNAVLHARSEFTVRLSVDASGLRIEVVDRSQRQPALRRYSPGSSTGRGLAIVQDVAADWGVETRPDGKMIWATLPTGHPSQHEADVAGRTDESEIASASRADPCGPSVCAA